MQNNILKDLLPPFTMIFWVDQQTRSRLLVAAGGEEVSTDELYAQANQELDRLGVPHGYSYQGYFDFHKVEGPYTEEEFDEDLASNRLQSTYDDEGNWMVVPPEEQTPLGRHIYRRAVQAGLITP